MAAYANHARRLGKTRRGGVSAFIEEALFAHHDQRQLRHRHRCSRSRWKCGRKNLRVMELLDAGPRRDVRQARRPTDGHRGHQGRPRHPGHRARPGRPVGPAQAGARAPTSTSTRTARCCRPTCIRSSASTRTWPATTAAPGRSRRREFAAVRRAGRGHDQLHPDPAARATPTASSPPAFTAVPGGTRITGNDFSAVIAKAQAVPAADRSTSPARIDDRLPPQVLLDAGRHDRRRGQGRARSAGSSSSAAATAPSPAATTSATTPRPPRPTRSS